jgi:hypothetical protein
LCHGAGRNKEEKNSKKRKNPSWKHFRCLSGLLIE